ncbi:MAG: YicC family protein [Chthoniobacterales bacterium]|nr:YicC family protein [Chthoniobacterales bacterium]
MRSMTGYGRGESERGGASISVQINSVNRRQSDIVVNLPRELSALEPRVREAVSERLARGRTNVVVAYEPSANGARHLALDRTLARSYHEAMRALQTELAVSGEITIGMILQAPGVMRFSEESVVPNDVWPALEEALGRALEELIKMRAREGKHLAKDLIHRLKVVRQALKEVRRLHPALAEKHRHILLERINQAGLDLQPNDERLLKEVAFFADRSDVSEELTRLDSHLAQFAHHLRKEEPVGRALEFITQEISRELNTLGAKAGDPEISPHVVACKAEVEKIREQIQNLE